jgi:hypothetical protein
MPAVERRLAAVSPELGRACDTARRPGPSPDRLQQITQKIKVKHGALRDGPQHERGRRAAGRMAVAQSMARRSAKRGFPGQAPGVRAATWGGPLRDKCGTRRNLFGFAASRGTFDLRLRL